MNFVYEGNYVMPGQTTVRSTVENQFWFGERHQQLWTGMVLSGASRDSGNANTTILRSGMLLGKVTATGKVKEWNPTATDGSEHVFGILDIGMNTQRLGSDQDKWLAYMMIGGTVKADRLLIPGQSNFGISGVASEYLVRAQMHRRFLFSDKLEGNAFGGWRGVIAKTADYTVKEADNNVLFTNRGAAGAVNFTLPVTAKNGLRYMFYCVADQTLKVTAGTADTLITFNDAAADSVSYETAGDKIGGAFEVIGDGTGWLVIPHNQVDGVMVQTITIAS